MYGHLGLWFKNGAGGLVVALLFVVFSSELLGAGLSRLSLLSDN